MCPLPPFLLHGQKSEVASAGAALLFTKRSLVRLISNNESGGLHRLNFCSCEAFAPLLVQMD